MAKRDEPTKPSGKDTGIHSVFLSYATPDAPSAVVLCAALEAHGVACWIAPRDVSPGAQYAEAIVNAINEAPTFVLVLSSHSVASAHVSREVERAASKGKRIIAFRIDTAPLSAGLEYFLSSSQWIDASALGLESALQKLCGAIDPNAQPAPPSALPPGRAARRFRPSRTVVLSALGVLLAAVAAAVMLWPSKHQADAVTADVDKSIAVLPFADMSEAKDQEYFADGMAEEILDLLVQVHGLRVIGRTSSFRFKGHDADLRSIGSQLGATYLLEGSVRKIGERVRVTAQLIDSRDGSHMLSQSFDRSLGDVFAMQDEIATGLVRALRLEVNATDFYGRPPLRNTEAYRLFLHGRHAFERFDQAGFEQATDDFERALELDPTLAGAAATLAWVYDVLGEWGFVPPAVAFEKARSAAQQALKIDPNSLLAHLALVSVHEVYDWDWHAADEELAKAMAIGPNSSPTLYGSAKQHLVLGELDAALRNTKAVLEQDPYFAPSHILLNWIQIRRGSLPEAESAARRALEISPTYASGHYFLGMTLLVGGHPEAAQAEFEREVDPSMRLAALAISYFALGRMADSDAAIAEMQKSADVYAFGLAEAYAYRGDIDHALPWLERAYTTKDCSLFLIKGDPPFNRIASDPRFLAFLTKMKL